MGHIVKLWKVKLRSDAKMDENVPVSMKAAERIHEELKRRVGMNGILCKVQEVQESAGGTDESDVAGVVG
jgi:hypothetical protein